jgi:hypothetical protein
VERVVRVFTEEVDLLAVYDEQLGRWRSGPMTGAQRREVERLSGQLARNRDVDAAILTLAENLKATTIDAILAKSDLELGLELGLEVFQRTLAAFPTRPATADRNHRQCATGKAAPANAAVRRLRAESVLLKQVAQFTLSRIHRCPNSAPGHGFSGE